MRAIAATGRSYLFFEREVERFEQRLSFRGISCGRGNRNVHATNRVDLVVIDLWKNNLLGDAHAVVALTIERLRVKTAEITNPRNRDIHETIEKLVHAFNFPFKK